MNRRYAISPAAWIVLAVSAVLAVAGFALPRLRPIPADAAQEMVALHGEHDALAGNDDATLAALRAQVMKTNPAPAWSVEQFNDQVGTDWNVEWLPPDGATRSVLLTRSDPRLEEWPAYLRFVKIWAAQPGVVLESLDLTAAGAAHARRFTGIVLQFRVQLTAPSSRDAKRAAPSRAPLPVVPADASGPTPQVGPGPPLRPASASGRSDPQGAPASDSAFNLQPILHHD